MYTYLMFERKNEKELVEFLTSETWYFHGQENPTEESIRNNINKGFYSEDGNVTFWILHEQDKIGIIRIFDLEDPICLFDIRLRESDRGKGIGKEALRWLCDYVFKNFPEMIRIEGHTRQDNFAMRKTFYNSGFVKESLNRQAWRQNGKLYDSVGYAMIREDWLNNTITIIEDHFRY
ncbi:GNAT family N-acetyltransferase [Peribacillus alkalitolerans]|uniref:GNAT family N-acetyltransferase n=1 Tax=Peribacillus alkalitolerans TaxID=1550385 RepID=UPI0013CF5A64|nr:GNAT family protein [Peribacillus alkalitolerans]